MKGFKPSLGCITIPLILQIITLIAQSPFLFVCSTSGKTIRGFRAKNIRIDGLSQRKLPETNPKEKNKNARKNDGKADKNKDSRNGIEKIETSQPGSANIEEDSGRDDVESPSGTSDSFWSLEKSKVNTTNSSTAAPETLDPPMTLPTSTDISDRYESDNIFESSSGDINTEISDGYFDRTKYVAEEKLEPITFNMTVSKFSYTSDYDKVKSYLKNFIEDVLGMKSNRDWYPFHSKSMHNISIDLVQIVIKEDHEVESAVHTIPVELTVNGLVFVHAKNQDMGVVASTTRNRGGEKQQMTEMKDSASLSPFHDSFDHSMFLYFTFWGVDDLQQILEQDGGLQNPVIDSVSSGNKRLITFGTDKDDNYLYEGDHHSDKPKKLPGKAMSHVGIESSAKTTKLVWLPFSIIVAAGTLL